MTAANPNQPKDGEISLEDIDKLLEAEDPDFSKQLEEVRAVENDASVNIESAVDDNLNEENQKDHQPTSFFAKVRHWLGTKIAFARLKLREVSKQAWLDFVVFLKTRPKEFFLYAVVGSRHLLKKMVAPVHAFRSACAGQKFIVLILLTILVLAIVVLRSNFKGVWLPQLNDPILQSFASHAEFIEPYDRKLGGESFYSAFPQERHEFLFPKMKVNLKRDANHPLPMGAFEVIVQIDSRDTAIEIRDREVELHDHLQRVFEEETFSDLETELGKSRLKGKLKRELNQKLTQGWVKDISFKTFVLKP